MNKEEKIKSVGEKYAEIERMKKEITDLKLFASKFYKEDEQVEERKVALMYRVKSKEEDEPDNFFDKLMRMHNAQNNIHTELVDMSRDDLFKAIEWLIEYKESKINKIMEEIEI